MGIVLGSIIIASGALYYFSGDLTAQASKIIAEKQSVSQQNDELSNLALLKKNQRLANAYGVAINQLLPDQYGIVNFQPWLTTIAKKYNVTVTSAFQGDGTPTSAPTPSAPGTILFSISIQGPIGSTVNFLHDIELNESGYLFTLSTFDYTSDSSGEKINAQGTLFFK